MGLFDIFTGSSAKKALNRQLGAINEGKKEGYGFLDNALTSATPYFQQGADLYGSYVGQGKSANQLYSDALGINGAEGNQRAQAAFQTSPGYQFGMDQGLQALDRRAASRGMLNSGNTNIDTLKYAQGYADQNYNNWMNQLLGLGQQGLSATSGQAGALGSIGNLISNTGTNKANVASGAASQISNAWGNWADAQNAASGNIWGGVLGLTNILAGKK